MKILNTALLATFFAVLLSDAGNAARVPVTLIEASVESSASEISLPVAESGIVTARACPSCKLQTFYLAKDRLLMASGKRVELSEMRAALQRAGNAPVSIHYRRSDSMVTRIVLLAKLGNAAQ